jgi:hypothetical protein
MIFGLSPLALVTKTTGPGSKKVNALCKGNFFMLAFQYTFLGRIEQGEKVPDIPA